MTGDVFTIDTATNRITAKNGNGMTYDLAGNQTYDATGNRWVDGENRMYKATQGSVTSHYVYDADGKRVRRIVGSTETWMIYGVDGELVAEYAAAASASSPQKEYGYRSGQMLIAAEPRPTKVGQFSIFGMDHFYIFVHRNLSAENHLAGDRSSGNAANEHPRNWNGRRLAGQRDSA